MKSILSALQAKELSEKAQLENMPKVYNLIESAAKIGGNDCALFGISLSLPQMHELITQGYILSEHTDPISGNKITKLRW